MYSSGIKACKCYKGRCVKALGLELYPRESPSNSVTAICAQQALTDRRYTRICGRNTGSPQQADRDQVKARYLRIAHLGYADTFDVITAIAGLEMVLKGMGHPVKLGAGGLLRQKNC